MSEDGRQPHGEPEKAVTGQLDGQAWVRCASCGRLFLRRRGNQGCCSARCSDRWYNARRPVQRVPLQRDLFHVDAGVNVKPETAPYQAHSETSREAAEAIERPLTKLRLEVLRAIQDAPGGLTDQEIQDRLGMDPSTERPRRVELVEQRLVVDSGETRETRAGRRATVWRVR